ncbi:MAG: hypothetical protein E7320_10070 [Clostridiales bacterium]|nr:hypothetical protein [Clostridiales bacterium]
MKIGKIILIVLGVALIALGVKGLMDIPGQKAMLEAAVYLNEPVVLPENEGKLVIIHGKPEMTAPAYDEELGLTLDTIKAYRYAEEYKQTSAEQLEYKYAWVSKGQKSIMGKASVGEFALDEKTLVGLPADSEYDGFDTAELAANDYVLGRGKTKEGAPTERWWVIVGGKYYYDAFEYSGKLDIPHLTREMNKEIALEREGAKAYAYKVYTGAGEQEMTIAGIQQGNLLVADDTLGPIMKDGVLSKEQVLSANQGGIMGGSVVFMLIGAVLAVLGLRKPKAKPGSDCATENA